MLAAASNASMSSSAHHVWDARVYGADDGGVVVQIHAELEQGKHRRRQGAVPAVKHRYRYHPVPLVISSRARVLGRRHALSRKFLRL